MWKTGRSSSDDVKSDLTSGTTDETFEELEVDLKAAPLPSKRKKKKQDKRKKKKRGLCLTISVILIALLVALIPFGMKWGVFSDADVDAETPLEVSTEQQPEPTMAPTMSSTTMSARDYISCLLSQYTESSTLHDSSTPQGKAFSRLIAEEEDPDNDPRMPHIIIQRYAILSLFYGTNGENWWANYWWTDDVGRYADECDFHGIECSEDNIDVDGFPEPYASSNVFSEELKACSNTKFEGYDRLCDTQQEKQCREECFEEEDCDDDDETCKKSCRFQCCDTLSLSFHPITEIDLSGNTLDGHLPPEICLLSRHIQLIDLDNNGESLHGMIPACFGTFKELEELELRSNALSGEIPAGLLNLPKLRKINLTNNKMSGPLGSFIAGEEPSALKILHLSGNEFSGLISETLGGLESLETLHLHNNYFEGDMPTEICDLRDDEGGYLEELSADCNDQLDCDCCTACYP